MILARLGPARRTRHPDRGHKQVNFAVFKTVRESLDDAATNKMTRATTEGRPRRDCRTIATRLNRVAGPGSAPLPLESEPGPGSAPGPLTTSPPVKSAPACVG